MAPGGALSRRRFARLAVVGAAALAGCSGPESGDDGATDDDPDENEPEDGEGTADDDGDSESLGAPARRPTLGR